MGLVRTGIGFNRGAARVWLPPKVVPSRVGHVAPEILQTVSRNPVEDHTDQLSTRPCELFHGRLRGIDTSVPRTQDQQNGIGVRDQNRGIGQTHWRTIHYDNIRLFAK